MTPTLKDIIEEFGFNPNTDLGVEIIGWFTIGSIDFEEQQANAQVGDLCVWVLDRMTPTDLPGRFVGKSWASYDPRLTCYYFRPCCS